MAATAALVWLRGPGFGCKAVWCGSAPCSVREFIRRHCGDQITVSHPLSLNLQDLFHLKDKLCIQAVRREFSSPHSSASVGLEGYVGFFIDWLELRETLAEEINYQLPADSKTLKAYVVPVECFFVKCNGSLVNTSDTVQHGAVYSLEPRLRGGKGGFGSMLRALGAQIEKTTNREACRDLSGRRLRDVNHEKAMAEWVKQQAEREAEKEQKRLERLQRKLAEPRHCFSSPDYQQQCHEMAERLEDSVLKGMQAASSKMVSAEIGESRKRPNTSKTDGGASAGKRKCFWMGMEGLGTAEGSSSENSDDDSEEAPSTSGMSFHVSQNGCDGVDMAAEIPSSSQQARVLSTDCRSSEKLQSPLTDSGNSISEDLRAELGETPTQEYTERRRSVETENTWEKKEAEGKEPLEKEAAGVGQNTEQETKEMTDGERAAKGAPGEDRQNIAVAQLEASQSGNMDNSQETLDLLAISSVAEMELLGLEKLKCELMARGLKCGGTLQERAARLFSVRGLAKGQIDPALFARPSKGKKK